MVSAECGPAGKSGLFNSGVCVCDRAEHEAVQRQSDSVPSSLAAKEAARWTLLAEPSAAVVSHAVRSGQAAILSIGCAEEPSVAARGARHLLPRRPRLD